MATVKLCWQSRGNAYRIYSIPMPPVIISRMKWWKKLYKPRLTIE